MILAQKFKCKFLLSLTDFGPKNAFPTVKLYFLAGKFNTLEIFKFRFSVIAALGYVYMNG